MDELTDQQRRFVAEYIGCLNGAEAARRAGYSEKTARFQASHLLTIPNIRAAIDEGLAAAAMPAAEILARLTAQARGSMADLLAKRGRGVALNLPGAIDSGAIDLVKKYTKTDRGVTVELYDAQAALQLLGKHYKLFTDVTEVSGDIGVKTYQQVSPDDWDKPPTE